VTASGPRVRASGVRQFRPPERKNASWWRPRSAQARHHAIPADAVALTADLLAMALAAGLTPFLALELVARFGPGSVGGRISATLGVARDGLRLADALDAEAAGSPALAPVLALLAASERSGAPVAAPLGRLANQIRAQERRRAMARARTVPVRLLFPLVFLVLPAFLLLTVAPVVLASLAT
jgi:Flp pilus assembly protein TadB